jgi:hypothetical protein
VARADFRSLRRPRRQELPRARARAVFRSTMSNSQCVAVRDDCGRQLLSAIQPPEGSGAPKRRRCLDRGCHSAITARARRGARPGVDLRVRREARSPLGAPPWRFSARTRASPPGLASGDQVQQSPRGQLRVTRSRLTCHGPWRRVPPPERTVASRHPGRHSPLRLPDASRTRPSMSGDGASYSIQHDTVKVYIAGL